MKATEMAEQAGVRPQMIYNYIKAERIPAERTEQGIMIDDEFAEEWIASYLVSKAERERRKQQKIEAELRGES